LGPLFALAQTASRFGLWLGGALILLSALVIGVDVVLRKALALSVGGADELGGYALAIGTAWGLSAALLDRNHIRIDSLYLLFPDWLRAALDILGLLAFSAVFGLIGWHAIGVVDQSLTAGSRSMSALQTPLALPQGIWLAGLGLFLAVAALLLVRALTMLGRRDVVGIVRLIGVRTAKEEATDEVRSAEAVHMRIGGEERRS